VAGNGVAARRKWRAAHHWDADRAAFFVAIASHPTDGWQAEFCLYVDAAVGQHKAIGARGGRCRRGRLIRAVIAELIVTRCVPGVAELPIEARVGISTPPIQLRTERRELI